jgi:flagellar basal-body rod modification protein FlgD
MFHAISTRLRRDLSCPGSPAMTTIASATAATGAATQSARDQTKFGQDFDSFLKLLTSQLKFQDPLSPMDTHQFTAQLVQFTSVEQQIRQNRNLESLLAMQQTIQLASASNYIGKTVEANGRSVVLSNGAASFSYTLPSDAKTVSIAIRNEDGTVVRTLRGNTGAGAQTIAWDGRGDTGNRLADGTYTYAVTATNANGQPILAQTGLTGRVDGFDITAGTDIILRAGTLRIPIGDVATVR